MVTNHGDRKSPNWGCSPYKWPTWLVNRGDPNHLLTGMILQVVPILCCKDGEGTGSNKYPTLVNTT